MNCTARLIDLAQTADHIIGKLLALQKYEELLLVVDTESNLEMAYALASAAARIGSEYSISMMPSRRGRPDKSNLLPNTVAGAFHGADVAIGLTRASFAPSLAEIQTKLVFQEQKLRYYSMALRDPECMMQGGALADYDWIKETASRLKTLLEQGRELSITTPNGTTFTTPIPKKNDDHFDFPGPFVRVEDGWATQPGEEAAFPDGEVFFAPRRLSSSGKLFVDGPIEYVGLSEKPVQVEIHQGRIQKITGDSSQARRLRNLIENIEDADIIGEVAIGINPCSLRDGSVQEEKKALGNCHIGFGIARPFPGSWMAQHKTLIHSDMVLRDTSIQLDGQLIIDRAELLF